MLSTGYTFTVGDDGTIWALQTMVSVYSGLSSPDLFSSQDCGNVFMIVIRSVSSVFMTQTSSAMSWMVVK